MYMCADILIDRYTSISLNSPTVLTKRYFLYSDKLGDFNPLVRDILLGLISTSTRDSKKGKTYAPDQLDKQFSG